MFGGPWDSTLNMMGVPSLKLGVPSFYISFEFWKVVPGVVNPSVKAQCCPQVSNFEGHVWPPSNFFFFFWGGGGCILPSVKHNPIRFFFTKAELDPIICRDRTNREKFEKIWRSDRLLHPEDRKICL